jgi:hypothetical protein
MIKRRKLTLGVREPDGQSLSLGLALAHVGGGVPHPTPVAADVGGELHVGDNCDMSVYIHTSNSRYHTVVVGADLEGLVPSHDQSGLAVLLVLQQLNITGTALLPLLGLGIKLEQLGAPARAPSARHPQHLVNLERKHTS